MDVQVSCIYLFHFCGILILQSNIAKQSNQCKSKRGLWKNILTETTFGRTFVDCLLEWEFRKSQLAHSFHYTISCQQGANNQIMDFVCVVM